MSKNKSRDHAAPEDASFCQAEKKNELKDQNPNQGHNAKKGLTGAEHKEIETPLTVCIRRRYFYGRDDRLNVVAYGGGTNSTAMLIGMRHRGIPVDLILFADTGAEQPHTYAYLPIMDEWLRRHGMPVITIVEYTDRYGERLTLEEECLRSGSLPSIAYGHKKCSLKHKIGTQDKYCNGHALCQEVWSRGERVMKFIGYDAGEERCREHAIVYDAIDRKYKKKYPRIDWGWGREECVSAIEQEGLPLPGKSSCFFCPSMRQHEIRTLYHQHRDLYDRAIAIEDGAQPNLLTVKGLGRGWSWRDFVAADKNQTAMCWMFPETDLPCGCYDGG